MYGQIFPSDEFSDNAVEDPQASPVPESTSDLLDQITAEPTQKPDTLEFSTEGVQTQATLSDNELTQADDSPSTLDPAIEEAPTESAGGGEIPSFFITVIVSKLLFSSSHYSNPNTEPKYLEIIQI